MYICVNTKCKCGQEPITRVMGSGYGLLVWVILLKKIETGVLTHGPMAAGV